MCLRMIHYYICIHFHAHHNFHTDVALHNVRTESYQTILLFPEFEGLMCFQIFHHELCEGLWKISVAELSKNTYTTITNIFIEYYDTTNNNKHPKSKETTTEP